MLFCPSLRPLVQPQQAIQSQEISPHWEQFRPHQRIAFPCTGIVQGICSPFSHHLQQFCPHICYRKNLCSLHISITSHGHYAIVNRFDAMTHEMTFLHLCQNNITHLQVVNFAKHQFVSTILNEWAHTVAPCDNRCLVTLLNQLHHLRQEYAVFY